MARWQERSEDSIDLWTPVVTTGRRVLARPLPATMAFEIDRARERQWEVMPGGSLGLTAQKSPAGRQAWAFPWIGSRPSWIDLPLTQLSLLADRRQRPEADD